MTYRYLEAIPHEAVHRRLVELWNFPQFGVPFKEGGRYFYLKNDGLQNQAVLYVADTLEAIDTTARVLLDPNRWSRDGTVALAGLAVSDDGKYLAYGAAEAGSDWATWRVLAIDSGQLLPDEIKWIKHSEVAWTKDGQGFFYSRFPQPEKGALYQSQNLNSGFTTIAWACRSRPTCWSTSAPIIPSGFTGPR